MRRVGAVGGVGVAAAVAGVLAALASGSGTPAAPSAVAGHALPPRYRLVLTEVGDHGRLHIASYALPTLSDWYDAPLAVESFRGTGDPDHELDAQDGDRATTVRGRPAVLRTLTDEEQPYAHELVWRERPDLVVSVTADFVVDKRTLRRVAEGVRVIDQPAWQRLFSQTSGSAQIGHVSRMMRQVRVEHGTVGGHRWTLLALIPPHFPLSRDDRRASCFELRFRHRRGHGDNCGLTENWQRVGGRIFVFGALYRPVRHLVIRTTSGPPYRVRTRTVSIRRGPRVNYFAVPLPSHACAVSVGGAITGPIRGPDQRRCARTVR